MTVMGLNILSVASLAHRLRHAVAVMQLWPGATNWPDFMNQRTIDWWQQQIQVTAMSDDQCLPAMWGLTASSDNYPDMSCDTCFCYEDSTLKMSYRVSKGMWLLLAECVQASSPGRRLAGYE